MKKSIIFSIFIIFSLLLSGLKMTVENFDFQIDLKKEYSIIKSDRINYYHSLEGSPSIPLKSVFFEIPLNKKISKVTIHPENNTTVFLEKKLYPIQKPIPLSSQNQAIFTEPEFQYYNRDIFPDKLLFHYGTGQSGNKIIGYISFYTCLYFPQLEKIQIPETFSIIIELVDNDDNENFPVNQVTNKILNALNLSDNERDESIKYLLIAPEQFMDEYSELINWRKVQGVETYAETVENIETNYTGMDIQEKVRNYITEMYETYGISYVTLGTDVAFLPEREVFAFDCGYGGSWNENDLPSDMYFSCLNGNWNANGNEIYGEEEDEVDYFPEVFVGRIPANTEEEAENYISALIDYESGIHPDYNKAGGFSMALWEGSDSEVCQQYIYENYFPEFYNIHFIYGNENCTENAYQMLNENQNMVQHTGHAGISTLSLQDGGIRNDNLDLLNNNFGGVFYSIGCWSAAIDYNSIGENLITAINKGMLGYVGNSRYGWGAPSASGFGFSEFFQKEFFKNIFWNETTILAEANAIQKIPFIPYFSGTSVYKWCAYELNALGDSYFNLFIDNPEDMEYSVTLLDSIFVQISSNGIPIENAIITKGETQVRTDINGNACLSNNGVDETIYIYKYGFKTVIIESSNIVNYPYIDNISGNEEIYYLQGENLTINSTFYNPTFMIYDFYVEYEFNENEIDLTTYENPDHIIDFSCADLSPLDIHINSINESFQMENGKEIYLWEKIYNAENDTLITQTAFTLKIKSPELTITGLSYDGYSITPGTTIPMNFIIENTGSVDAAGLNCTFISNSEYLSFAEDSFGLWLLLPPGNQEVLNNQIIISDNIPEDFVCDFNIELQTSYLDQNFSFSRQLYLPVGEIGIFDDFETSLNWDCPLEWQQVDTYSKSGTFSFSCRPENIGTYTAESPTFVYLPGMELSFWYKYEMPMYGNDGVYFTINYENECDSLIFLGAGGALPENERPLPEIYIESDWAEYNLDLDETILNDLDIGTTFKIKMIFKYAEVIEGFNQYSLMDEIGVFIDDFLLTVNSDSLQIDDDPHIPARIKIYPTPFRSGSYLKIALSVSEKERISIDIYNVKGQLVQKISDRIFDKGEHLFYWNGKNLNNHIVKSGVYFIKVKKGSEVSTKKFLKIE